ncbi:ABC transporter ATP-binding protein [Dehalococcoidia bacterium]|nr:ABC transporter ATP-binding protein [Dehalococcoidia bacterium]
MDTVVVVKDLRRDYIISSGFLKRKTRRIEALRGIDLTIYRGESFGIVGPNGAGKTTLIRILTTTLLPTSGEVRVLGYDASRQPQEIRKRIGLLFGGEKGLYTRLSVWDNMRYFANLYGIPRRQQHRRIKELLTMGGLSERIGDRVSTLSRGMRQRLHIARALLSDPDILFLDEPTIGLDPIGAHEFRNELKRLHSIGKTLILTTHYMYEAELLCDRVAILNEGRVVMLDAPDLIRRYAHDFSVIEIEVFGPVDGIAKELCKVSGVLDITTETRDQRTSLLVQVKDPNQVMQHLPPLLEGMRVYHLATREPTLEDAYIRIISASESKPHE